MFNIGGFFEKFAKLHAKEVGIRQHVSNVIKKHLNIDVPINNISIKNRSIHIKNIPSIAKNILFIKRDVLIAEFNSFNENIKIDKFSF
jgi:hypothetical protein